MDIPGATIILFLSALAGLSTLIGVGLALLIGRNDRAVSLGMGFSAGLMVCMSLLDLIPEALSLGTPSIVWSSALAGAGLIALLHYVIPHIHLQAEVDVGPYATKTPIHTSLLVAVGLVLHDFPEGFAMASAYLSSPHLGVLVAIVIMLHNIPEQFAIAMPAVKTRNRRFLYGTAFLAALAEPAGAIFGLVVTSIVPALHAVLLAFAAGAMLYVSLHELLPLARRFAGLRWVVWGIIVSLILYALLHQLLI